MALHKKLHTSWIFKSCKFGTFRHVNSVALELYNKSASNICYSRWDRRHFVPDIHLMTSRKLPVSTFGHVVISAWPWRICPPTLVQRSISDLELLTFSRNSTWRPSPSWIFKLREFGIYRRVDSMVLELCTKLGSNTCYNHWDRALMLRAFISWRHAN